MNRRCLLIPLTLGVGALQLTAQDVVINEIHYQGADKTNSEEFVELHNRGDTPVDLSGWFFSSGIDYTFENGVSIEPGGFLVVAEDPDVLAEQLGVENALGPYEGQLANEGERIVLRNSRGLIEDEPTGRASPGRPRRAGRAAPWS